ncbi:DUF1517 domain-containing protein [filamentous cyanobacterium LEGE 11480]|uniref:DUF1517 domain-containing protein n=1 Tax=Romeriopsis navalis LEGE 11480 TaxID=2777977 RepID=A0A928VSL5_9CYAN|nr:DUF1517 domain-containing protein [Romeriopsis navalis]MBE9031780.1 DUF1517 domain-containing protein [Romeriopsis navalis LEGE 11480]
MKKILTQRFKPLLKTVVVFTMIFSLVFGQAHDALAAGRSGGRMGGGSFRRSAPSRSYRAPSSGGYRGSYGGYGGGYGRGGGGFFFFPSPWLFLGGGGGSLFTLLILAAIGSYLFQAFRQAADGQTTAGVSNPSVSVAKVQVGLLADARSLQKELNQIAMKSNTGNSAGLAKLLQESTLALLRHPEYWVYGGSQTKQARLESAEAEFNRMILMERSKVAGETLSNIAGELKQKDGSAIAVSTPEELAQRDPGAYIVVTLIVGTEGKLNLPTINGDDDLRTALNVLGAVSSDKLLAVEVLWTPQAEGDVLTRDEMVSDYPSLKLV